LQHPFLNQEANTSGILPTIDGTGLAKKGQRGYSNSMASEQEHQELQTLLDSVEER
jgi:hypothetical protein